MKLTHTFEKLSALTCLLGLGSALTASATAPPTITLKDWTGRGFSPDLVNYTIPMPADGGKGLRLLDANGMSLPVQLAPREKGLATLSFVAVLASNSTTVFTVRTDGQGPVPPAPVSVTRSGDELILASQLLAVKVPAPLEKTFNPPVPADKLPAPLLAFRGPDGAWHGEGSILHQQPVKSLHITQVATGPVFTEVRYRLDYESGGFYAATIRVTDQVPFAQVTEEYDLGASTNVVNTHFWQLDLSKGWKPDAAEHMFVAGQGYGPCQYPSLADEEKAATSGPQVGQNEFGHGPDAPTRCIHHDSCWGSRYVSYYGIFAADARKTDPGNYPLAMVAPLHKGFWRRANSLPVYVKDGDVRVCFPMDVVPLAWQNEPVSDTSPFSCHERPESARDVRPARVGAGSGLTHAAGDRLGKSQDCRSRLCRAHAVRNGRTRSLQGFCPRLAGHQGRLSARFHHARRGAEISCGGQGRPGFSAAVDGE